MKHCPQAEIADLARSILAANRRLLRKRWVGGAQLSPDEKAEIGIVPDAAGRPREYVETVSALARVLGVSRRSFANWRLDPSAPRRRPDGQLDVAAWRRWIAAHSRCFPRPAPPTPRD